MILECGHKICISLDMYIIVYLNDVGVRHMIWNLNVAAYIEDFRTVMVKVIHCCTEAQPEALVPSSLVLNC